MKYVKTFQIFESVVQRKKEDQIISYSNLIKSAWMPKIKVAQEFQKINFDLENNDSTNQKKTFYIKRNLRKDQPIKYKFNAEMCKAGGDWERPVMYFRIELECDHGRKDRNNPKYIWDLSNTDSNELHRCYVIIPGPDVNHLAKTKKGYTAHTDDTLVDADLGLKGANITDEDEKKAWTWLEEYLEKYVEDRHEMLDAPNGSDEQHKREEKPEPASVPQDAEL